MNHKDQSQSMGNSMWDRFQMTPTSLVYISVLMCILFGVCGTVLSNKVRADSYVSPIETARLSGINSVTVLISPGPLAKLSAPLFSAPKSRTLVQETVDQAIKDVFAPHPWIHTFTYDDTWRNNNFTPNMLGIYFTLSAQQTILIGKPVTVAALSVSFKGYSKDKNPEEITTIAPVTYPFIVPDNHTEFLKQIATGVKFLTDYVPSFLCSANEDSKTKPCNENYHPWTQEEQ